MKFSRKDNFVPVEIVLDSQDDVDKMFAMLNHVDIAEGLEMNDGPWHNLYRFLKPVADEEWFWKMRDTIKKGRGKDDT